MTSALMLKGRGEADEKWVPVYRISKQVSENGLTRIKLQTARSPRAVLADPASCKGMSWKILLPIRSFKTGEHLLDLKKIVPKLDCLFSFLGTFLTPHASWGSAQPFRGSDRWFHKASLICRGFWKKFNDSAFQIEQMDDQKNEG